jgi:thymidine kinase
VAELTFFYGTMNCGKSTLALQIHHNVAAAGKHVLLFTKHDRGGVVISSRIGLSQPAVLVTDDLDLRAHVGDLIASGTPVDELICDEAQFYSPAQVGQLARIVDELAVEVNAFGLLTDFTSRLFPGSQRLLELADRRQELQVSARCWCGERGSQNARTVDGVIQRMGEQVVVGDVDTGQVAYEVLCRRHFREGTTRDGADGEGATATPARAVAPAAAPVPSPADVLASR